ncbi:cohesin domain-containing protein [Clostridium drakei]|uniref:Cohesin domain-containing protein n=1 Tax=Clostridium drakei TaxID=332101 RepID=A0A2U8DWE7_9CLOT|nr:cohesin domain-containing protein [Clostridium drakei]AWI06564.1 hypothetical protein B9W14_19375 [Clostridium drakei]
MKNFKNFIGKVALVFCMALIVGVLGSESVFAANVGDQLNSPEAGWKRYGAEDKNFQYSFPPVWYGNKAFSDGTNKLLSVSFNFKGTKLRIIGYSGGDRSSDLSCIIDGKEEKFNQATVSQDNSLNYSKEGLENREHSVKIKTNVPGSYTGLNLTAIDIDVSGELKPYNENIQPSTLQIILNVEPEKNKIRLNETVSANLTIDNIKDIAAEDVRIKYDNSKLQFLGATEVDGIKLVKNDAKDGELRLILASKGSSNVVEAKKSLLKLNFKGIAAGDALVDVTKGRVSDGITMEKDLTDDQCGQATITIDNEALTDVNKDGQFTLLDLAIDGRHYSEDPATLTQYNTDIVVNKAIDDDDLTKIGEYMLANPNYKF